MKHIITERVAALRKVMLSQHVDAFIVPSTDPHSGEYVPAHWECRKWISGFTGSAGTAVITADQCGLWTDSRYFLQAEEQLEGTEYTLFKDRLPETPSIPQWLGSQLPPHGRIGIDGTVNTLDETEMLKSAVAAYGLEVVSIPDPFEALWTDRPSIPLNRPFILPLCYAGESCQSKLARIRESIHGNGAEGVLLSALD